MNLSLCCQKPVKRIGKEWECSVCKQRSKHLDPSYDSSGAWVLGLLILGSVVLGISLLIAEGGL